MAARALKQPLPPSETGTIRRVVRVGGQHICGMCRSPYERYLDAQSCVQRCFQEFLCQHPVVMRRDGIRVVFRCRLCARDYEAQGQAMQCAQECRLKFEERQRLDLKIISDLGSLPPPPKKTFKKRQPVMMMAPQKKTQEEEPPPPPVEEVVEEKVEEVVEEPPKKVRDPKKKWAREGAEYVCTDCLKHYYTKIEASQCWDSHEE